MVSGSYFETVPGQNTKPRGAVLLDHRTSIRLPIIDSGFASSSGKLFYQTGSTLASVVDLTATGGGGGSGSGGTGGAGGSGGGGTGGAGQTSNPTHGAAGTVNTGGGAGGSSDYSSSGTAASAGGSGVVVIRYKFQN